MLGAHVRLSIARHGRTGWRWTMLLTAEDDAFAAAVEFRTDDDGRGTWMRMVGDSDDAWEMVTSPEWRAYPADETEARMEIAQVSILAAADLVRAAQQAPERRHEGARELTWMPVAGTC